MGKDPAFLFYPGDWLGGTMTFTRAHKGAYMDLLMAQFNQWSLTMDDIIHILGADFNTMWESKLKPKFSVDSDSSYFNVKLRAEMIKRKSFTDGRINNLQKSKNSDKSHMGNHMDVHMENENDNRDLKLFNTPSIQPKPKTYDFNTIWGRYPKRDGRKAAERHFNTTVKSEEDFKDINQALDNYLKSRTVKEGFIKNGSTWFNNWRDWINYVEPEIKKEERDEHGIPSKWRSDPPRKY